MDAKGGIIRPDLRWVDEEVTVEELIRRPWRPPDDAGENRVLIALMEQAAVNPERVWEKLAAAAVELCRGESAGVALFDEEKGTFHWNAVVGKLATPSLSSALDRMILNFPETGGGVRLFADGGSILPSLDKAVPAIHENMLATWGSHEKSAGVLWVASHEAHHHFDSEDSRLLGNLARYASSIARLLKKTRLAKAVQAERRAALNLMEDAVAAREAERRENADRRRAEAGLRESEEWLRLSLKSGNVFTWKVDPATYRVEYSENVADVLGFDLPNDLLRNMELVVPDDLALVKTIAQKAARESGNFKVEYRIFHPGTREILWLGVEGRRATLLDPTAFLVGITQNITQRKQSEETMAANLADMHLLQDLSTRLITDDKTPGIYHDIVAAAMALTRADGGSMQILDHDSRELVLLAADGFPDFFLAKFKRINASSYTSCGVALAKNQRTFVDFDVPESADSDGSLRAHVNVGYFSAQSTPLVTRLGKPIGMVSTHWRRPHRPSERELGFLDLLARQVADLIEQKEGERALRASENRLRTLADAVPQIIWTNDGRGFADYFNRRWYEYTGLTYPESEGAGWQMVVHPDDAARAGEKWEAALVAGVTFDVEFQLRRADGMYRWFIGRNVPLRDARGKVASWFGTATDIHDLKEAQAVAREKEEQFRRAIEDAPIPVIMHADDGQVLAVSRNWTILTGYTRNEVGNVDAWLNTAQGSGVSALRERMNKIFSGGGRSEEVEFEIVTRSGEHRYWIFSISAPGTLRDGRRFAVGMAVDVTERRRVEQALAASQEWLRLIVESAQEHAILSADLHRVVTSWNSGAERMLGYAKEDVIGRPADLIFTPEDRLMGSPEHEAEVALTLGRAADERWHLRKDGSRFWGSGVMMPMRSGDGNIVGFVKIFRDETEKREAMEALKASREVLQISLRETEQARAEAQSATEAKDRFIAVLSHELRTPLTPVLMASHLLARRKDLPAPVREAVGMIRANVQLEAHLVDDLLDVTRIAAGKMELNRSRLDVHEVIKRAVEITRPEIDEKKQELVLEFEATETQVDGDATRLQQVVWNLLKNAAKFTPAGGKIVVSTHNEEELFFLSVRDSGIGIEADALVKIFDAFTQANAGITREFGGLGLGLSISKAAVVAHGGDLTASSKGIGQGATFTAQLPLVTEKPT